MTKTQVPAVLPSTTQQRLAQLVEEHGVQAVAASLGVSRGVVERACGNLPLRRGSVVLLLMALRGAEGGI